MSKRVLSLVLALVMVLGAFSTVFAQETENAKVQWLVDEGLVVGDAGGLRLADPIKRSEVAVMVTKALDLGAVASASAAFPSVFKDMSPAHWANGFVNVAAGRGFMSGYPNGNFVPENNVNYAEMASMLVRVVGGITPEEQAKAVWPTTWLAKAAELGLFDGVVVADYNAPATREHVFEMVYNALINKQAGNYTIVKGIVLENYRVETLAKDEVVIEVIKELQTAEYAKVSRTEKGDQLPLVIPAKVGDVENLLGKVADFTLDKDGKVVAVKVDDTYKYVVGSLAAVEDALKVGTTEYTVVKDERLKEKDDRVFRTYFNNKSYQYSKFATKEDYKDAKTAEFARVTVKNGKVLFIDAFTFDDVAPVKEVRNDGKLVYVYDDYNGGAEKRLDFNTKTKVVSIKDKVMNAASLEDIDAFDVVHYNKDANFVFVRLDAAVEGEYEKFSTASVDGERVINLHVEGEKFEALQKDYRRAVYSYDGEEYTTLTTGTSLEKMRKEDVTVLLDMNNKVQLVTSDMQDPSFLALVVDVIRGEVRFAKADGTREDLTATFDTKIKLGESTKLQNLNVLRAGDLVRVESKDGELTEVQILASRATIKDNDKAFTKVTKDYVTFAEARKLIGSKTKLFVDLGDGKMKGLDIATLLDTYKSDEGMAYVYEVDREVVAIVFTELTVKAGKFTYPVVRVVDIIGYDSTEYEIVVENDGDSESTHAISRANARKLEKGDIVELKLKDNEDKDVADFTMLIEADAKVLKVLSVRNNEITLADKDGDEETLLLLSSAAKFGDVRRGEFVSIHRNSVGDIDVIEVRDNVDYELGLWSEFGYTEDETDQDKANAVIELINAIPTPPTQGAVDAARAAYNALTAAQKVLVSESASYTKLTSAEAFLVPNTDEYEFSGANGSWLVVQTFADRYSVDLKFASVKSNMITDLVIKLYDGSTLLATNKAKAGVYSLNTDNLTSPFYFTPQLDAYWDMETINPTPVPTKVVVEFRYNGKLFINESSDISGL